MSGNNGKFGELLDSKYAEAIATIKGMRTMTGEIGQMLSDLRGSHPFYPDARQFAMLLIETPQSIILLLRSGHLAPAAVLLRWYLEMSQLLWFLWKNPESRERWKQGNRIYPREIGQYFESTTFPTWRKHYEDLCNAVHGNCPFMDNFERAAAISHGHEIQPVMVGNILCFIISICHESNWFLIKMLQPTIPKAVSDALFERLKSVEPFMLRMSKKQEALEKSLATDPEDGPD